MCRNGKHTLASVFGFLIRCDEEVPEGIGNSRSNDGLDHGLLLRRRLLTVVLDGDAAVHADARRRSPRPHNTPGTAGLRAPTHHGRARGALSFYKDGASSSTAAQVVNDDPALAPPLPPPFRLAEMQRWRPTAAWDCTGC